MCILLFLFSFFLLLDRRLSFLWRNRIECVSLVFVYWYFHVVDRRRRGIIALIVEVKRQTFFFCRSNRISLRCMSPRVVFLISLFLFHLYDRRERKMRKYWDCEKKGGEKRKISGEIGWKRYSMKTSLFIGMNIAIKESCSCKENRQLLLQSVCTTWHREKERFEQSSL